jgi:hypothetical protein
MKGQAGRAYVYLNTQCMCTSIHNADFIDVHGRVDHNTEEAIHRPSCIIDYDKYMGAVDRCDQMITYPAFKRRTLKWWKKIFFLPYADDGHPQLLPSIQAGREINGRPR